MYKRCRNVKNRPRQRTRRLSTTALPQASRGVVGYLYLGGFHERLAELMELAYAENGAQTSETETQKETK